MEIQISVRELVEFILRSGDIDHRKKVAAENAMLEGGRIHRKIQRSMGSDYHAEVPLSHQVSLKEYSLMIHGRADGIIDGEQVTVDEIKGTYCNLDRMEEPVPVHLAQAKCYAYFYALDCKLDVMRIRMTYCNLKTEETRYFYSTFSLDELKEWFEQLIERYVRWTDFQVAWKKKRQASIKKLSFPYSYRKGQKELAAHVYRTIVHQKKLFLEAPTGVGKTLSTVFPSLKAMGEEKADRMFYLTAKTVTATVAEDTLSLLRQNGLQLKSVILTAKEKICFMDETSCNPVDCPYAKGHYDRVNDAMYDLLLHEDHFSREVIARYAEKYRVCPFELGLDMSLFSDTVICDYNYVFDPHVYLRRFFGEGSAEKYIFLVDEAHNLVERGREMYSATLVKEEFLEIKKQIKIYDKTLAKEIEACNHLMLQWKKDCENYRIYDDISGFLQKLDRVSQGLSDYLENHDDSPVRDAVLEFYFKVSHFQLMAARSETGYVIYSAYDSAGNFFIRLFNVDPSENLKECMERGCSSILFSATLLPIQYYKSLLGGEPSDYEVYAESTFENDQKRILIGKDVTTRYTLRSTAQYRTVASYLYKIVTARKGNYMAFFPSHVFLKNVFREYENLYGKDDSVERMVQQDHMNEADRLRFIQHFTGNEIENLTDLIHMDIEMENEKSLLGFCVMGGIFSEGIDLKKESLIGAIIVGTGLPQLCLERELMKYYFDEKDGNGYNYAYLYPGMNKVLQAAGRVIRTGEDRGIIALLDDRFLQYTYQKLFPREWDSYEVVSVSEAADRVKDFWHS